LLSDLQAGVQPLREKWKALIPAYVALAPNKSGIKASRTIEIMLAKLLKVFTDLAATKDISDWVQFPSDKSELYESLSAVSKDIAEHLAEINNDKPNFLLDFASEFEASLLQAWEEGDERLRGFYRDELQKIIDLFQWLFATHTRLISFRKLAELDDAVSEVEVKQLGQWITKWAQPFINANEVLNESRVQIDTLNDAIEKLEAEQKDIEPLVSVIDMISMSQPKTIQKQLESLDSLTSRVLKWKAEIEELQLSERAFNYSRAAFSESIRFVNVSGVIFLRFKHLFLIDNETKEIFDKLKSRAEKHKKPANKAAIQAFMSLLLQCNSNLSDLVELIQKPLRDKKLGEGDSAVGLERERGGPTETCALIERLNTVMLRLIGNHQSIIFLDDLENKFKLRQECLNDRAWLDRHAEDKPVNYLFNYHYKKIVDELAVVVTKRAAVKEVLQAQLEELKKSDDDELTKLKALREMIATEHQRVSQSRGGEANFFHRHGSKLGAKLKEQLERLDQVLAAYPVPVAARSTSFRGLSAESSVVTS
jgi:hypothetical protein